jgi:putative pre-16S rRNA nuclease
LGWDPSPLQCGGGSFLLSHCIFVHDMGRIMGIDFGTKRIGVAATDTLRISVHGKGTYTPETVVNFLNEYLQEEPVDKIVVGMPSKPSDRFSHALDKFVSWLTTHNNAPEIVFHDEDYTSFDARQALIASGASKKQRRNKQLLDEVSAVILLQDYLGHRQEL